ncbi:MAG: PEP-CTERM sorting domain-containing protein [Planctomycetota bacterium]
MKALATGCVCALAAATNASAQTQVRYSSFDVGDTFNVGASYSINGDDPGGLFTARFDQGFTFTVDGDGFQLDSIEIAGRWLTGANSFNFSLYTAEPNGAFPVSQLEPGDLLETITIGGFSDGNIGLDTEIREGFSSVNTPLVDGETYYLVAETTDAAGEFLWSQSTLPDFADRETRAFRQSDTAPWLLFDNNLTAAFRVNGVIPAPGTAALLGLGGLTAARRRR